MYMINVPDDFWYEIQRRHNFLDIPKIKESMYIGKYYLYFTKQTPSKKLNYARTETLSYILSSLKENEYKIHKTSISIYAGLFKDNVIHEIEFIEIFNIKTIHDFVKIISSTKEELIEEFPHQANYINSMNYFNAYLDLEVDPKTQAGPYKTPEWGQKILAKPLEKRFRKCGTPY